MSFRDFDKRMPSRDSLEEAAYLVSRGVRPLAIAGSVEASADERVRLLTVLAEAGHSGAIPFCVETAGNFVEFGYSGAAWAVDLLRWARTCPHVPAQQADRIYGLLLGYSTLAIRDFDELAACSRGSN